MKLNSLLLSSAAVLVAGTAFAADLPSKKAAPAASAVTVCKVGETAGFTLPGSETCVKLNGRVTYDVSHDNNTKSGDGSADYTLSPGFRVGVDALSNTEIGVVRSFIRMDGGSAVKTGKAYIQFAGVTAGVKDSLTDIYGTTGNQNPLGGNGSQGIDYKFSAGDFGFGLGIEDGASNNAAGSGDRQDIVAQLSGKAGPLSVKVGAASHQSISGTKTHDGYAVKGSVAAALGQFNVIGFGGTAQGASGYIGGTSAIHDYNGTDAADSRAYGAEINATFGKLLVAVQAANYENKLKGSTTEKVTELDVYASYTVAKGLTIQPEYRTLNYSGTTKDSNTAYIRIQRDF